MSETTATKELERAVGFDTTTLGALINALAAHPPENSVQFDFCGLRPSGVASYRGFYAHLAIGWCHGEYPKVSDLLAKLRAADGSVFTGYKGGDYTMGPDTPVWVANLGECDSTAIVAVEDFGYTTILRTRLVDV